MLFLNLSQLEADLSNLVQIILISSGVVGWFEQSGLLDVLAASVVNLEFLSHHAP